MAEDLDLDQVEQMLETGNGGKRSDHSGSDERGERRESRREERDEENNNSYPRRGESDKARNSDSRNPDRINSDSRNPDRTNSDSRNPDRINSDSRNPDRRNSDSRNPDRRNSDRMYSRSDDDGGDRSRRDDAEYDRRARRESTSQSRRQHDAKFETTTARRGRSRSAAGGEEDNHVTPSNNAYNDDRVVGASGRSASRSSRGRKDDDSGSRKRDGNRGEDNHPNASDRTRTKRDAPDNGHLLEERESVEGGRQQKRLRPNDSENKPEEHRSSSPSANRRRRAQSPRAEEGAQRDVRSRTGSIERRRDGGDDKVGRGSHRSGSYSNRRRGGGDGYHDDRRVADQERRSSRSRTALPRGESGTSHGEEDGEDDDRRRKEVEERRNRELDEARRDDQTVLVLNLPLKASERDIWKFFSEAAGKVRDIQLIRDSRSGKSKGVGYVEFFTQDAVIKALALSGQILQGAPIKVQSSQAEKNRAAKIAKQQAAEAAEGGPMKIYVGGLVGALANITEEELTQLFSPFGEVSGVDLQKDPYTAKCRGFAFIGFKRASDAREAMAAMNGFEIAGSVIRVGFATDTSAAALQQQLQSVAATTAAVAGGVGLTSVAGGVLQAGQSLLALGAAAGRLTAAGISGSAPINPLAQLAAAQAAAAALSYDDSPDTERLDDDDGGGLVSGASTRIALMQKLQRDGTGPIGSITAETLSSSHSAAALALESFNYLVGQPV